MNILEVNKLSCGYDTLEVIKGISFSVTEGELLGVIGPNGAGKTTLFRVISNVLKPWKGRVLYKGKDVSKFSARELAREVAVVPQLLEIPFAFSVEDFVLMGRFSRVFRFETLKKADYDVLEEALNITDTASLRGRMVFELSGGERQRVILAQGFAQEPKLLLLDEPTAHLDIAHQVQFLDLVKKLNKGRNLTVIMVLHDLNLASGYCDRLILLDGGVVFKEGAPDEVVTCKNVEEVYKTEVVVGKNPVSFKPHVFMVSGDDKNRRNRL